MRGRGGEEEDEELDEDHHQEELDEDHHQEELYSKELRQYKLYEE